MSKYKVVLFDVDGVLFLPRKWFSHFYAEQQGLDKKVFDEFFAKTRDDVLRGKANYRDLVAKHHEVWRWDKDPQELLDMWFAYEEEANKDLVEVAKKLRQSGAFVYLATHQDRYRARYLIDKLFKGILDGAFVSSDFGYLKTEAEFFDKVIKTLKSKIPDLKPKEIVFFDDIKDYVDTAKVAGISAHLYKDVPQVRKILGI